MPKECLGPALYEFAELRAELDNSIDSMLHIAYHWEAIIGIEESIRKLKPRHRTPQQKKFLKTVAQFCKMVQTLSR